MAEPTKVKIDRAVGKNMVKISVSHTFGQNEQLNAEMDVPLEEAEKATEMMFEKVVNVRELDFRREVAKYQLEQDLMAYEAEERDIILRNKDVIKKNVKARIDKNKKEGKYNGENS
jgi:hypothetical protein